MVYHKFVYIKQLYMCV